MPPPVAALFKNAWENSVPDALANGLPNKLLVLALAVNKFVVGALVWEFDPKPVKSEEALFPEGGLFVTAGLFVGFNGLGSPEKSEDFPLFPKNGKT